MEFSSIAKTKTAKEATKGEIFTKFYEAKSLHNKKKFKRKLYSLSMVESTSMKEHLNTLSTLYS